MAARLLYDEISELCLGKPELPWISATASISHALAALKESGGTHVSVWECGGGIRKGSCICVGKFSLANVILFLSTEDNLADPFKAFEAPVSEILTKTTFPVVRFLEANSSLLEAIDYILEGTQNLVIPIKRRLTMKNCHRHNGQSYCWLNQEDILRYLINSITAFSPITTFTINSLDIIDHDFIALHYNEPASSALAHLSHALTEQKPIAVVDEVNRFIGEISPFNLSCCDETAAAAIATLSIIDLMAYMDSSDPPEDLIRLVKIKLEERNLTRKVDLMDEVFQSSTPSSFSSSSSSCSSDDESMFLSGLWSMSRVDGRCRHYPVRKSETVICRPGSSLVAVILQALTNRTLSVWVVDKNQTLVGTVTLLGILKVLSLANLK